VFFQTLEKSGEKVPMLGTGSAGSSANPSLRAGFQTIGNFSSDHWKNRRQAFQTLEESGRNVSNLWKHMILRHTGETIHAIQ